MARSTIDFGIDLGTTNSEIACMDRGELEVIKNSVTNSEVTPSVVKIDGRGRFVIGQSAYNDLEYDRDNVASEFKRWMGNPQHDAFEFRKSGKTLRAAELSAEVLKVLKASASARFGGEEIKAAVVTVPAMFLIPACEDTKAAAKLAGIDVCPLLQEPVAAAMAYGYEAEKLSGNLLVFDLGGGTFDTTVLTAKEGRLVVVGHSGDDKLGGKEYDWALVDIIASKIRKEYGELGLSRREPKALAAFARLKYLAEDAKKNLSMAPVYPVEVNRLQNFDHIDMVIDISREELYRATEVLTRSCIEISSRLLRDCGLSETAVESVLVVGGPTRTPYIQEQVKAHFGKIDSCIDAMTVVARGAALYASTQRIPQSHRSQVSCSGGALEVKVAYNPVSSDSDAEVGVAITPVPQNASLVVTRADKGWHSGSIPLPSSGKVLATVGLRARKANTFDVEVLDTKGSRFPTNDASFTITQGLAPVQATTSRAFSVALADNTIGPLIAKGVPLPAKGERSFETAHEVLAGDSDSILKIYVLEGDNPRADRNIAIGLVELKGSDLRRTLPAREIVKIRYKLDESKTLSAEAFFEFVKESRPMVREYERPTLSPNEIEIEVRNEKTRLSEVQNAASAISVSSVERKLSEVQAEVAMSAVEPDSGQKAAQRMLEVKQAVDILEKSSAWELLTKELDDYREWSRELLRSVGTPELQQRLEKLLIRADDATAAHSVDNLRKIVEDLCDLYYTVLFSQDDFWRSQFARLRNEPEYIDVLKAQRLIEEGDRALKRNDIPSLRTIVWELHGLLPTSQRGALDRRFHDAGLKQTQSKR
jgi:molecular chaperone DnaK